MVLTRFVRNQLFIFAAASLVGIVVMALVYMQVPTLLGIGRMTVTVELPAAGGLYRFSNVTYRGVEIGKVTAVQRIGGAVKATLSLDSSAKIPTDLVAEVHSVSAVGELYLELRPRTKSGPYLHDGSVIAPSDTRIPPPVGPMLDKLNGLVSSVPKGRISDLLDEAFTAFNGAGYDLSSLADSSSTIVGDLNSVADQTSTLYEDSSPLLDSQVQSADALRRWAHSLASFSDQLVADDPHLRALLSNGSGATDNAARLLDQVKPTLPVLLANLTTVGQIGVIYHPGLEQLLVVLPPLVANIQSSSPDNNPTGIPAGDFRVSIADPPACTVGFLPPSQWRSPADTTTVDTPDGLYCKLPQDSPIGVRGARNSPCMGVPGKRAPTVRECEDNLPFQPLALRQHALGPYPLDPNLIAQGVPPDDRVTAGENLYVPVEGTPMPPGLGPPPSPPPPGNLPPEVPPTPSPVPVEPGVPASATPPEGAATPNAFDTNAGAVTPSVGTTQYDPRTGRYAGPTGRVYQQLDLVTAPPKTWQDLMQRTLQQ